jgi:lipopolysaccharide biosynthesis glycosyltransferase
VFNLTIIFDSNYVEPALVTALDLERFSPADWDVTLIYIESQISDVNSEIFSLLGKYVNKKLKAISLKGELFESFEKFHFTNSILYKLILPEIAHGNYIVNVDAGFLSGPNISFLFEYCEFLVNSGGFSNSPIAAICSNACDDLPLELRPYRHNAMYPFGWLLLFNTAQYKKMNFFSRVISGYRFFKDKLVWAEQDLLCLITNTHEITQLDLNEHVLIEQLSLQGYILGENSRAWSSRFMLYKITGTLKPWKRWVFDNKKQFYLSRRNDLMSYRDLEKFQVIQNNWYEVTHQALYRAFLAAHEKESIRLCLDAHK